MPWVLQKKIQTDRKGIGKEEREGECISDAEKLKEKRYSRRETSGEIDLRIVVSGGAGRRDRA